MLLLTTVISAVGVATAPAASAETNGVAITPPMGFDDWNAFKCSVSAALIEQTADFMVSSGMKTAGYQYVNIDDCWLAGARAADGSLVADPVKFPDGIKAVADYVHAKGLKLGIYEDAGTTTCAGYPGSLGHESQDAATFASWDVDYLKYDQCNIPFANYPNMTHQQIDTMLYTTMSKALLATGRNMVFSMCNGTDSAALPWLWGAPVSNLWRTTTDIQDTFASMVGIVDQNAQLAQYAAPGAWNDPDMLEIGNGGMTNAEYQSEFSLWSEMAAPLIAGTSLTTASAQTISIYTNKDVIAVDQDSLGRQGQLLSSVGGREVFAKPLLNGDVSVALFNSSATGTTMSTTAAAAGLRRSPIYSLKDLWSKQVSESAGAISAFVPAHATVMYRVSVPKSLGSGLLAAPHTTLAVGISADPMTTGSVARVTVSLTDDGLTPIVTDRVTLSAPAGWKVRPIVRARPAVLRTGQRTSSIFEVTAPAAAPPISSIGLTADAPFKSIVGARRADSVLTLPLVSPVAKPYLVADTTGTGAVVGQSGTQFAIQAAGTGVSPTTTTTRGTTPAADQYGSIYLHGAAHASATAQTTVTGQPVGRAAKAGLMMRNDITGPAGSPEGVVLYVTGSGTVGMSWDAGGGATVDTSSALSAAQVYPVQLRLVRNGAVYTGYFSPDGTTWTQVAVATLATAAATQDVGVFHTSGSATTPSEADFTGLTVTG
ncbi:alpha-galactosidase [Nakamurella sp. UYEF19]|uniref:NEW3 domain-containing protein n=1 Tax=Nakamurella sp. UYEF19 TaxID=1756392 RepID=UPI003398F676